MGGCPDVEFRETISLPLQSGFLTEMPVVRGQACSTRLRLCDDAAPFHCADQCVRVEQWPSSRCRSVCAILPGQGRSLAAEF